jgi:DNA-binding transcriptional LysR family regulator
MLTLPQFHMVALAAARTDCIGQLPRRIAEAVSSYLPLRILEPPLAMPKLPLVLIWHERTERDPGSSLFRDAILAAVRSPKVKRGGRAVRAAGGGPAVSVVT